VFSKNTFSPLHRNQTRTICCHACTNLTIGHAD
jgi:hypothetical protein